MSSPAASLPAVFLTWTPGYLKYRCLPPPPVFTHQVDGRCPCSDSSARRDATPPWSTSTSRTAMPDVLPVATPMLASGASFHAAVMIGALVVAFLLPWGASLPYGCLARFRGGQSGSPHEH